MPKSGEHRLRGTIHEWTQAEDDTLRAMARDGASVTRIAAALGPHITYMMVRYRIMRLRITRTPTHTAVSHGMRRHIRFAPWTPEQKAAVLAARDAGMSIADIARFHGLRPNTARQMIEEWAAEDAPVPETARPCLRCRAVFQSRGRGHRLCDACRDFAAANSHLAGIEGVSA